MLWVGLFIAGLFGVLAGMIPLILNGARGGNAVVTIVGALLLVTGAAGVIIKPSGFGIKMPRIVFGQNEAAKPVAVAEAAPEPEPAPVLPTRTDPPVVASPSKDDSHLAVEPLPKPVSVTTTTVIGNEVDPLANPAAPAEPAPAQPTAAVAPPAVVVPAAPEVPDTANPAALLPRQTKDEAAFTKAILDTKTAYENADDNGRAALQATRATAVCNAVRKPDIQNWVGILKELDKDAGGRTIVTVVLPDGTLVKTWNNAMSDVEDKTLIPSGTPLAATFSKLAPGDAVQFSGHFFADEPDCYRSSRLSFDQSMTEPSFLFRFTDAQKL